ncbi:MFS transporter [Acinetobacter sp. C_4_1]|uniref:MFS transporter n=1 Tax=unclassified Acinetobacter TaxID=196816 RepID=UPI0021B6EF03|nr:MULTISPECIES: MFS transporter [unclassified Acinetobacter]MCT8089354.1 MFS transporter [Acinetobacter sp. F_3_1]MCT8096597.1 MFS transporter [Acinetobacter sp. C_3_1]MCT8100989.1 MFS transporter [Acinetobacter sp. C_4_1]MCT8134696.1 MFS transporter [Acinetobacter sp. T_3_1]
MNPIESNVVTTPLTAKFMSSFVLLTIIAGLGVGVARVLISLYAVHLNASELQLGLISAAQNIGILLMALPIGVLVQRLGSLKVFSIGSVVGAVLYFLTPLHANAWYLMILTALVSCFLPMRFVSINTVFLSNLKRLGPAKAGWFRGSHMMGFFLIAPALSVLLIEHFGYSGSFYCVALLFLGTLFFAPFCFQKVHHHTQSTPSFQWRDVVAPLALLKTHAPLRVICALEFLSSVANNYFGFFIVVIAIQSFALPESMAVMLLTTQGIIFVGSLFTLGGLAELVGYQKFYLIGLGLISSALLILALTPVTLWMWPASLMLGLGLGMLHIANFMSFAKVGEQTAMAKISPILALVGPTGGLFGGFLGAALGASIGLQNLFFPIGLAFLALILLILRDQAFISFLKPDGSKHIAEGQES